NPLVGWLFHDDRGANVEVAALVFVLVHGDGDAVGDFLVGVPYDGAADHLQDKETLRTVREKVLVVEESLRQVLANLADERGLVRAPSRGDRNDRREIPGGTVALEKR